MKKFYALTVLFILVSLLTPMQGWAQCTVPLSNTSGSKSTNASGVEIYSTGEFTNNAGIDKVTFSRKKDVTFNTSGISSIILQYSVDNNKWQEVGTLSISNQDQPYEKTLSGDACKAKYFRVITDGGTWGSYKYIVSNFTIYYATSLSASENSINFNEIPTGKSASRNITLTYSNIGSISGNATSPYSVNIVNSNPGCPQGGQDTTTATITYHPTAPGNHNQTIKFTGSNGGQVSINVSGSASSVTNPQHTWSGSDRYKVGDNIDLSKVWTSNSSGSISYAIKSFTPNTAGEEGATAPSLNGRVLSLGQAGKVELELVQNATTGFNALTSTKTITVEKYTLSASINQSTATWDETISNPFTVKDDREEIFSGYSVTALDQNIADYVNGQIVTYSTNGTAQARFTISYGETYKYNALSETLSLTVAAKKDISTCDIVSDATKYASLSNSKSQEYIFGENDAPDFLYVDIWEQSLATGTEYSIIGYKSDETQVNIASSSSLSTTQTTFNYSIQGIRKLVITVKSTTLQAYFQNVKVTRLKNLNANETSVEAVGAPGVSPSGSFDVNYSDCGSTFTVRSSNPKISVSPTTFNNVSAGSGIQKISFTGDTQANGKETATITVYNQSRKVEVKVTCYQQYKISFVTGQGASTVDPLTVTFDKAYNLPEDPQKIGYTFEGWYTAAEGGTEVKSSDTYTLTSNQTLYAHWKVNTYTLTFELNDGSWNNVDVPNNQTTITYNKPFGALLNEDAIQRSGYTFKGWYSDKNFSTKVVSEDIVSANPPSTLYAKWEIIGWTVTFDANYPNNRQGAPYSFSDTVPSGKTYTLPTSNPSIAGYTFTGWKTENDIPVDASTVCQKDKDHTLYGCWEANKFNVTYSPNQGNWSGSIQSMVAELTYDKAYGQDNKFPAAPTREGYTFQGWWTAEDGGQEVTATTVFETAADQTLYAHWSSNNYKLIFDYKDEAGTFEAVDVTYDAKYPTVDKVPTRVGFTFVGWYDANNTKVNLSDLPSRTYTTAGNERFFAHWIPNHYTVKFKTDADSEVIDSMSISVAYHDVYGILPNLKENGAEVTTSWYDAPANGMLVTSATIFQPEDINQDFVLYAATSPRKFALQLVDGNETTTIGITKGQTYAAALAAAGIDKTETGKTFLGWSDTQNGNLKNLEDGFDETCQTLYARWKTQTIEVRFVDAEHSAANYGVMSVPYGETYGNGVRPNATQTGLPVVAEVDGKTFDGWSTESDNALIVTNTTLADLNVATLYAHFTAKNYIIYLHENLGVDKVSTMPVTFGADYSIEALANVAGYDFAGWYEQNAEAPYATSGRYAVADDLHLYARWDAVKGIDVAFALNDGTANAYDSKSLTYGGNYSLPETAPTREGYTFVGWFTAATNGTEVTAQTVCNRTAAHTLYAHWMANNYTIYLHENTGVDKTSAINVTYGETYTLTAPAERTGYTFAGWFTKQEGGDLYDLTSRTYETVGDLHLYAHWTAVSDITVSFNANGGKDASNISATYGQAYGNLPTTTKNGYTFVGWFTAAKGGTEVTNTTICKQTANHTLYAHWTANNYTIYLHENTGVDKTSTLAVTYGQTYTLTAPAGRTGYTFAGWFTQQEEGKLYDLTTRTYETVGNLDLYAHWTAVSGITVSFMRNDNTDAVASTAFSSFDAAYELPATTPTRDGYTFVGWFTAAEGGTEVTNTTICKQTADHTLYAHWTAKNYTIYLHENTGVDKTSAINVTYGETYTLTDPAERTGYAFAGWFEQNKENAFVSAETYDRTSDLHLYAHWTAEKYTVTFNVALGVTLDTKSKEVTFDSPYGELPTPTLAGYEFAGWYSAELLGSGSLIVSTSTVNTASNHNLYARWTEADITIHFDSNGGSEVADVTRKYQANYCEPALPIPTREGYTLIGWYFEDGTLVTSTTTVDRTEAHTLTAYWAQAGVPYLVLGDNWKISSPEADNDYRFKTADGKNYSLSNIRVKAESSFEDGGTGTTVYQASVTIFLNGVFYGVGVEQGQTKVLQTTENGNSCLFTANSSERATIQSAEMNKRWFNFDLYEESSGTWKLSISCGKQGNPTEVDNNESEQPARAKKYIDDGKVFIQTKEDRIYNASGQLVK